jgi:hypothetical protein
MTSKKVVMLSIAGLLMTASFFAFSGSALAQEGLIRSRLASAPPYRVPQSTVEGSGDVWWSLNGSTLELTGTFKGLASASTVARIHMGRMTAIMGDPVFDLNVEKAEDGRSGIITGSVNLNSDQVQALRDGRLYVQLDSEGTENGHLQGWLLQ